jgi:hypothetical protein
MDATPRQHWFRVASFIGISYGLVGILFALPSTGVRIARLAAWIVSGALYAVHLGWENLRYRHQVFVAAWHVAAAVAVGGFVLAVAATIHKALATSAAPYWRYLLALVVWPLITATPAFFVALLVSVVLGRVRRAA